MQRSVCWHYLDGLHNTLRVSCRFGVFRGQ
ncbi:MAG: DUF3136 domain-containing protein [Comamonas sp.]|nr:DUF3136 domain-containing protein [Comamonas sp.]